jgi:3-hydroxyisobutyrate dehydrogenase-like beta-hydroxyacid dehydrogenase
MSKRIGIVHPGAMGIFVAASLLQCGSEVLWASEGRSRYTKERAKEHQLADVGTFDALLDRSHMLVSVCPPHAALEVAQQAVAGGYSGLYLDANAISPGKSKRIGELLEASGITYIDGGIIGRPDWNNGNTRLYLSGEKAGGAQELFAGGMMQTANLGKETGKASALKMCYASYTKGTSALLANTLALAEENGVGRDLAVRWEEDWPGLHGASSDRIKKASLKAWRFSGEMQEISETFREAGLPGDFHLGASEIYNRLSEFKNSSDLPALETILARLLNTKERE